MLTSSNQWLVANVNLVKSDSMMKTLAITFSVLKTYKRCTDDSSNSASIELISFCSSALSASNSEYSRGRSQHPTKRASLSSANSLRRFSNKWSPTTRSRSVPPTKITWSTEASSTNKSVKKNKPEKIWMTPKIVNALSNQELSLISAKTRVASSHRVEFQARLTNGISFISKLVEKLTLIKLIRILMRSNSRRISTRCFLLQKFTRLMCEVPRSRSKEVGSRKVDKFAVECKTNSTTWMQINSTLWLTSRWLRGQIQALT